MRAGRKKIFDEEGVVLKFKVPKPIHGWLAAQGKPTLRSASLHARDILLAAVARAQRNA